MNSRLQRWWLWGCFAATLLASWAGGFGVTVTAVFIGIYLTGLVLIGPDEPAAEADDGVVVDETDTVVVDETAVVIDEADAVVVDDADAEPYPDDDESETAQTDTTTDTASEGDSDATLEPSDSSR